MRVLGIDLGSKRVGLALSDAGRVMASPHSVLLRSKSRVQDHRAIAALVSEMEVGQIVVGLPLSLDGSVGKAARAAISEAKTLGVVTGVPVETYDERLTTVSAQQVLREQGVASRKSRDRIDMVAAAVLLQAWLDAQHSRVPDQGCDTPEAFNLGPHTDVTR